MADTNVYKVKLTEQNRRARRRSTVTFDVTPDIQEQRQVNYETMSPLHAPGQIFMYGQTQSRTFNVSSIQFVSRTVQEADLNLQRLWILRSWTMPNFGTSSLGQDNRARRRLEDEVDVEITDFEPNPPPPRGLERRGEPPQVLLFSAYSQGSSIGQVPEHINKVPVVIDSLNITYPSEDVDYIHTSTNTPMPMILSLDITLRETHSPREYEQFSLIQYKRGIMPNF